MLQLCDDSKIQLVTCHCHVHTLQCLMTYTVCYGRYDIVTLRDMSHVRRACDLSVAMPH